MKKPADAPPPDLRLPAPDTSPQPRAYRRPGRPPSAVTQAEVDRAALGLLSQGEKPSIDKVMEIVGGSTATVGPLLANFWQRLFGLAQMQSAAFSGLPGTLPALAEAFFVATLDEAFQVVRQPAEAERLALDQRAEHLAAAEDGLRHAKQALEERLRVHDAQFDTLRTQLTGLQQQLREQSAFCGRLLAARDVAEKRVEALQSQLQENDAALQIAEARVQHLGGELARLGRTRRSRRPKKTRVGTSKPTLLTRRGRIARKRTVRGGRTKSRKKRARTVQSRRGR